MSKEKYSDLNAEQYELLLFRGELVEDGRPATAEFVLPLIDKRLQEIREERERSGLAGSDPAAYAEAVRDSEDQLTEIAEHLNKDAKDHI
jgi:hypothetical protein